MRSLCLSRSHALTARLGSWSLVVAAGLVFGWVAGAGAQVPRVPAPTPAAVAAVAPPAPTAVPAAEVTTQSQATRLTLKTIQDTSVESEQTRTIRTKVDDIDDQVTGWAEDDGTQLGRPISPDRLEDIEGRWKARSDDYTSWGDYLSSRVQELSDGLATLDKLEGPWKATETDAATNELAEPVVKRIHDTLAEIDATRTLVQDGRNAVLTLQDRVAKLAEFASNVLVQVGNVRRAQQENLFVVDSVPLWTAIFRAHDEGDEIEGLGASIERSAAQVEAYFLLSRPRVIGFLFGIVSMIVLVSVLRSRASGWAAEDESLAPVLNSLSRPISGGFLLAALSFPWIFTDRPAIVAGLLSLAVIPPLIRFLSPLVSVPLRRALYAMAAWLVVDLVRNYLVPEPLVNRLLLLAEDLAVLVALIWFLRSGRLGAFDAATRLLRLLGAGLWISAAIIAVAVVSNVLGNVTLAGMLTQSLIQSLFMAAVLVGAAHVVEFVLVVGLRTEIARELRMVRLHGRLIRERILWLVRAGLVIFWLVITLRRAQIADDVAVYFTGLLNTPMGAGDFEMTLGHLVGAAVVLAVAIYLSRFTRFVLEEDVLPRTNLPRGVPYTVSVLAGYGIIVLGSFAAVAAAGIDMSRFALVLSALSVGIGIGLQDVVNNFVSGLILLFERPLKVGDTVEVADVRGEIRHIGLRSSTVRTWDGSEVVIPNSRFIADQFTNWTLSDRIRRIQIDIGVAYGTDPVRVIEILIAVAGAHEHVMEKPGPSAIMVGFGESSLDFSLRVWTEEIDHWTRVRSEVVITINQKLAEAGIEIPFPQRDVHILEHAAPAKADEGA